MVVKAMILMPLVSFFLMLFSSWYYYKCKKQNSEKIRQHTKKEELELEQHAKNQKEQLKLFQKIVGECPLKQIDWIIENGYEKYLEINGKMNMGILSWEDTATEESIGLFSRLRKLAPTYVREVEGVPIVEEKAAKIMEAWWFEEEIRGGIGN